MYIWFFINTGFAVTIELMLRKIVIVAIKIEMRCKNYKKLM